MSNRCEDYPCCGHTDGLGCNYTPDYAYINAHALCDHEAGVCDAYDEDEDEGCDPRNSYCAEGDFDDDPCRECATYWLDFHADGMEDQWLDGSYEE